MYHLADLGLDRLAIMLVVTYNSKKWYQVNYYSRLVITSGPAAHHNFYTLV